MVWFVVGWLLSPLVVLAGLRRRRAVLDAIRRHDRTSSAIGWAGGVAMLAGIISVHTPAGMWMFIIGTPLTALAPLRPRTDDDDRGEDGGGGPGGGGGPDGDPGGPPFNWPQFEREFWAHVHAQRSPATSGYRES